MEAVALQNRSELLALDPGNFVRSMPLMKRIWSNTMAGMPAYLRRRRLNDLLRELVRRYKRRNGPMVLPRLPQDVVSQTIRNAPNPEDLKIVIIADGPSHAGRPTGDDPRPDVEGASSVVSPDRVASSPNVGRRMRRKQMKRLLRGLSGKFDKRQFELVSARKTPAADRYRSTNGMQSMDSTRNERAIYLEALGAAICPGLSDQDVENLEAAGAQVIDNTQVVLIVGLSSAGADEETPLPIDLWHRRVVGAEDAHLAGMTGKGVTIGILDTGIDDRHPEFVRKRVAFRAFGPDGLALEVSARDFHWHGTHVSGICAGSNIGVAPDADLAVAAVLTEKDSLGRPSGTVAQVVRGLEWLSSGGYGLDRRAAVINASIGLVGATAKQVDNLWTLLSNLRLGGRLTIAAIGNNGRQGVGHHTCPGNLEVVLGVGATDRTGSPASFSDWGAITGRDGRSYSKPDIAAPGVGIVSSLPRHRYRKGPLYGAKDGTSMASPIVAGCAALAIQADSGLLEKPDELNRKLLSLIKAITPGFGGANIGRCGAGVLDITTLRSNMV